MNLPCGLAVDSLGNLFVGDHDNSRVLRFNNAAAKVNGANADGVLGQTLFTTFVSAATQTGMHRPCGVAVDQYGRLYVGDTNNNRVLIFDNAATLANGAAASNVLGQPDFVGNSANNGGISARSLWNPGFTFFDDASGRLWVGDVGNNCVLRYTVFSVIYLPLILR